MIRSFNHKGLEAFFTSGSTRGINANFAKKLRRQLAALDQSKGPQGMDLPGWRLHPLKGDRVGEWAVWVSGNWRLVFKFEGTEATDVDLTDYH